MTKQDPGKALLENAYQLQSPEDNIAYYEKLAASYDEDFAEGLGYALPDTVAKQFHASCQAEDSPILDVGCGTGLLADALNTSGLTIDGIDISDAMLALAERKQNYRRLMKVDLTQPLDSEMEKYGAILSCGTFTHGHLGPDALVRLLGIAKRNGLFVISINKEHFRQLGFESVLQKLKKDKAIHALITEELNIYNASDHEHSADKGLIVTFRTA